MTELNKTQNSRRTADQTPRRASCAFNAAAFLARQSLAQKSDCNGDITGTYRPPSPQGEKERRRNRRELRQRASIADAICTRKPVGCTSPSKTFKHVSRQTNVFLRLENRHFAQYAAFYTSSRVAPQSLPHAFCAIFSKTHHIEHTSTHTFYAR